MRHKVIWLALSLFITACSSDAPVEETKSELGDVAAYTTDQLAQMVDEGNDTKAARIIAERAQKRLATVNDFILLADIYNTRLDGIAAELALDQANTLGATRQSMALPLTKALMLQQRFAEAKTELKLVPLTRANGVELNILDGEIEQALGNPDNARRYFSLARDIEPDSYRIDTARALLEMSVGNFEDAKKYANAAIEKNTAGGDAKPHYALGAIDRLEGDSASAITHLKKALAENPEDMLSQLEIIGAYLDTQQTEQAEIVLDELIAKAPNNILAQFYVAYILADKGENQAAEDVLLQAGDLLARYRPAKRLYGHVAYDLEKYDAAASYLEQYLDAAPTDTETRLALADTHSKVGRPQEALKVLEPVIAGAQKATTGNDTDNTDTPPAPLIQGPVIESLARAAAAQQSLGNIDAARQQYEKAIALAQGLEPKDPALVASLTAVLASMEYNTGNRDGGLALMSSATANDDATTQELTTLANMQMINGKLDDALATAERLKATDANIVAQNIIGTVEYRRGNYDASVKALTEAINQNPNYASALKNRASAYIAQGQFDKALADLLILKPQAGNDGQYYGMLGQVQLQLKNYVAAIDAYETARNIIPNSALFTANYASALGAKGRYAEAITQAKAALQLAPDNAAFKQQVNQMLKTYEAAVEEEARNGSTR